MHASLFASPLSRCHGLCCVRDLAPGPISHTPELPRVGLARAQLTSETLTYPPADTPDRLTRSAAAVQPPHKRQPDSSASPSNHPEVDDHTQISELP